jgi:hypothetical protein
MTWSKSEAYLYCATSRIKCWSKVRNEINGLRPRNPLRENTTDVCHSVNADGSEGVPIMPRTFPVGNWRITGFKEHPDPTENHGYLYPVFINTDAVNEVPEWELDDNGLYHKPTGRTVTDHFLGLHFSTSDWTQGCLRIDTEDNIRWLWNVLSIGDEFVVTP